MTFLNWLSDVIVLMFSPLSKMWGLVVTSMITAIIFLVIFKYVSNQDKIRFYKKKIFGHFLETAIYRDQFMQSLKSQASVLKYNFLYLKYFLWPIVVMLIPLVLVGMQLDARLGMQPLGVGERFAIEVNVDSAVFGSLNEELERIKVIPSKNIEIDTNPIQSVQEHTVQWRGRIVDEKDERYIDIIIEGTDEKVRKNIADLTGSKRISVKKVKYQAWSDILYMSENPILDQSRLLSIAVSVKQTEYKFLFWKLSPILIYFILIIFFGFLFKPFIKVSI